METAYMLNARGRVDVILKFADADPAEVATVLRRLADELDAEHRRPKTED